MDYIKIYGVKVHKTTLDESTKVIEKYLKGEKLRVVFTPNTEIIMAAKKDNDLKDMINRGDLITPDGIGLIYASMIKKNPLIERVTGFDLSIKMLEIADKNGYSIYLLGGKEGVAKDAGKNIKKKYPNIDFLGCHNGYFKGSHLGYKDNIEELSIIEEINHKTPDIIFVGLGFPRQEKWIDENKSRINAKVIIGNGGVMDVLSGNTKRAPEVFQRLGLEWLYRLLKNPSRIKRQLILPKFFLEVIFKDNIIK